MEHVLVDSNIRELLSTIFESDHELQDFVQPATLDWPITNTCFLVKDKMLPVNKLVKDILDVIEPVVFPGVLLKHQTYLILLGKIHLPKTIRAVFSPKSSIGRIDVMVRAIVDKCGFYDSIEPGTSGEVWIEVSPRSFHIRVHDGIALTQVMLLETCSESNNPSKGLELFTHDNQPITKQLFETKTVLSLNVQNFIGYVALNTNEVIDISKLGYYKASNFFQELVSTHGSVVLEKDKFYILATTEYVKVGMDISVEMVPFSHHIGELRAHYAGFFDPGFGRCVAVLEIRAHETVRVSHAQPIALMECFHNKRLPTRAYGEASNHYQWQTGPKLAKYFV